MELNSIDGWNIQHHEKSFGSNKPFNHIKGTLFMN